MDVAVLGVGAAGEVTARLLATRPGVDRLRLVDVRRDRLLEVSRRISRDIEVVPADLSKADERRRALRGIDIVVNAAGPKWNLSLMRQAIRQRVHYLDLSADSASDPKEPSPVHDQLALDPEFRRIGRTAILGMGIAPGISGLLVRRGADGMDRVESVRIRVYGSGYAQVEGHRFAPLFAPEGFLEEVLWPAAVWNDGRVEKLPPFSGEEEFRFPDPIGRASCYHVNEEEVETIPATLGKGVHFVDFKYAIAPERKVLLEGLHAVGLTCPDPIEVKGVRVAPLDLLVALLPDASSLAGRVRGHTCVVVDIEGRQGGRPVGTRMWSILDHEEAYKKMGVHATAFLTGAPPVAAVDALIQGEVSRTGVTPGAGLDPTPILRRARDLGVPLFEGELGAGKGRPMKLTGS